MSLYPDAAEAGGSLRSILEPKRVRRYCAANRLGRLGTLTYAGDGCHNPRRLRADVTTFFRCLRQQLGGGGLP